MSAPEPQQPQAGLSLADVGLSAAEKKALSSIDKDGSGNVCVNAQTQ